MIRIGHASIAETGGVNGSKGDQTGREVRTQAWYSYPWTFMAVHPSATVRDKHAKAVEQACANDKIGYGQSDRNTLYPLAKAAGFDLSKVGLCNCDCSSLQNVAAVASGSGATYGSNGWCTFNMESALRSLGYAIVKDSKYLKSADYCIRGAIYVNTTHHTACGLDNGSKASEVLSKCNFKSDTSSASSSSTTTSSTTSTAWPGKLDSARFYDKDLSSVYHTTASLNLRSGAGTGKYIIVVMPKGSEVRCHGYYNLDGDTKWLCVQYDNKTTIYTGYCSSKYLTK